MKPKRIFDLLFFLRGEKVQIDLAGADRSTLCSLFPEPTRIGQEVG